MNFSKTFLSFVFACLSMATASQAQMLFTANLDGAQCVPAVSTTGTGTGWFVLDPNMSTLTYQVTVADLSAAITAAHIHIGATGANGGVFQAISFSNGHASGTISGIVDTMMLKIFQEGMYINVHTTAHGSGEIRGQLMLAQNLGFTLNIDTAQAHPGTASSGRGTGYAWLDTTGTKLHYQFTSTGLTGAATAMHFHNGAAGVSGGVAQNITGSGNTISGVWMGLTPTHVANIIKEDIYVNIHTSANGSGEIRGQVERVGNVMLAATLNGGNQVPAVSTSGKAQFCGVLDPDAATMNYQITYAQNGSAVTAAHFHFGTTGNNGGVANAIGMTAGNTNAGVWSNIADTTMGRLLQRSIYINVHTTGNGSGEIRGQVWAKGGAFFTYDLDGDQAGVSTSASGTGWATLQPNGTVNYWLTVAGLSGAVTASHIHQGAVGVNGGVISNLSFVDSTAIGTATVTNTAHLIKMLRNESYVNVHTAANGSGEIRGQMWLNVLNNMVTGLLPIPTTATMDIRCYPNPVQSMLQIRLSADIDAAEQGTAYLFDARGSVVAQQPLSLQAGVQTLSMETLPAGAYILTIAKGNQLLATQAIIKQ